MLYLDHLACACIPLAAEDACWQPITAAPFSEALSLSDGVDLNPCCSSCRKPPTHDPLTGEDQRATFSCGAIQAPELPESRMKLDSRCKPQPCLVSSLFLPCFLTPPQISTWRAPCVYHMPRNPHLRLYFWGPYSKITSKYRDGIQKLGRKGVGSKVTGKVQVVSKMSRKKVHMNCLKVANISNGRTKNINIIIKH